MGWLVIPCPHPKGEGYVWVSRIDSVILREGIRAYKGNWRKRQIGLFGSKSTHSRDCCEDALESSRYDDVMAIKMPYEVHWQAREE